MLDAGVPDSVAPVSVTPLGKPVHDPVTVGAGEPLAVAVKVPAVPTVKVALLAEVNAGA